MTSQDFSVKFHNKHDKCPKNELCFELEGDKGGNSLLKKHTKFIIKLPCKEAMLDIDTPRDMNEINK